MDQTIAPLGQKLTEAGRPEQAEALQNVKDAAAAQISAAADTVADFVTSKGLGALPVSDLSRILSGISSLRKQQGKIGEGSGDEGGSAERTAAAVGEVVAKAQAALADDVVTEGKLKVAWSACVCVWGGGVTPSYISYIWVMPESHPSYKYLKMGWQSASCIF